MSFRTRVLGSNMGYATFLRVIRANHFLQTAADEMLRLEPPARLLDLGCGNGALAEHLPEIDYTGIDHNRSYIAAAARQRGGPGRRFICADLVDLAATERGTYDAVCAIGVLHHLDDELARAVIADALPLLKPGGRFVSIDPVFHPDQRSIARVLMALDRGKYVRHPAHYRAIASSTGAHVEDYVRTDLNPFPYTHFVMEIVSADVAQPIGA